MGNGGKAPPFLNLGTLWGENLTRNETGLFIGNGSLCRWLRESMKPSRFKRFLELRIRNLLLLGTETGRCLVTILITPAFARSTRRCDVFAGNISEHTTRLIENGIIRDKILVIIRCG